MRPPTLLVFDNPSGLFAEHPLAFAFITLTVGIALVLGYMHEGRIFLDSLIPLVRHLKQECRELRESWRRFRREVTTWKEE